jgi:sec-independent protein translocase protein TatB
MLNFGFGEILLILALALVVVGPDRLPEMVRFLGRQYGKLMRASNELRQAFVLEAERSEAERRADLLKERREAARARAQAARERVRAAAEAKAIEEGLSPLPDGSETTEDDSEDEASPAQPTTEADA